MPALAIAPDHPLDSGGLRVQLRDATAAAHAALDGRFQALDLTARADYRRFLAASAAALLPLEQALAQAGVRRLLPDWDRRARADALRADLARLDGPVQPLGLDAAFDRGHMLGTLYVLEGSRLGARLLLRQVAASTDPLVRQATAYLRHGEGQRLWPDFLAVLAREASTLDATDVVAGASAAFALFLQAADRL